MIPMSFLINDFKTLFVRFLVSLCFRCRMLVYRMLRDCELKCNIIVLVIHVVRYVSLYLLQKWLEIFSR